MLINLPEYLLYIHNEILLVEETKDVLKDVNR